MKASNYVWVPPLHTRFRIARKGQLDNPLPDAQALPHNHRYVLRFPLMFLIAPHLNHRAR
jgi:hypothetical protein